MVLLVSINQGIDIGQVEGAFVQGMGYYLSEKIGYDPVTGVQLTTNTWVSLTLKIFFE